MKSTTRINELVTQALTKVEQARDAKTAALRHRYYEQAAIILKTQIPQHPNFERFCAKPASEFFGAYLKLSAVVAEHERTLEPDDLESRYSKVKLRKSDIPNILHPPEESLPTINSSKSPVNGREESPDTDFDEPPAPPKHTVKPRVRPPIPEVVPPAPPAESPAPASQPQRLPPPVPKKDGPSPLSLKNTIASSELNHVLKKHADYVLILDVRDKSAYANGHINAPNVTCLEYIRIYDGITDNELVDSLVLSSREENLAFSKRFKAKIVVIMDDHSTTTSDNAALANLRQALLKTGKIKNIMVLVGGYKDWVKHKYPTIASTPPMVSPPSTRDVSPFNASDYADGEDMVIRYGQAVSAKNPSPRGRSPVHRKAVPNKLAPYPASHSPMLMPQPSLAPPPPPVQYPVVSQYSKPAPNYATRPTHVAAVQPYHRPVNHPPRMQFPIWVNCGLKNLGNTCYMNCVLQCLLGTPEFIEPFLTGKYREYVNVKSRLGYSGRLAHEFANLATTCARATEAHAGYVAPFEFKKLVGQLQDTFMGYEQQDCQEFLTFLLDGLHEDLNSAGAAPRLADLTTEQEKVRERMSVQVAAAVEWERYMSSNASLVVDLFQGQYVSRLKCTVCGNTSTTYTAFSTLTLPLVAGKRGTVDLAACFDAFVAPEYLEGDNAWHCSQCNRKQRAVKKLNISRLPQNLIIHLKRFRQTGYSFDKASIDKIEMNVNYPFQDMDLSKYWPSTRMSAYEEKTWESLPRKQSPPFIYDLYALTSHHGTLKSGHYTAFVKKSPHGWFHYDDTNVVPLRDNRVTTRTAYVLFYRRRS